MMYGEWWLIVDAMTMNTVIIIIMISSSSWIDLHDTGALSWNLPIPMRSHGFHGSPRIRTSSIDQHGILRVLMNRSRTTPFGETSVEILPMLWIQPYSQLIIEFCRVLRNRAAEGSLQNSCVFWGIKKSGLKTKNPVSRKIRSQENVTGFFFLSGS